jgi:hypothetical protein
MRCSRYETPSAHASPGVHGVSARAPSALACRVFHLMLVARGSALPAAPPGSQIAFATGDVPVPAWQATATELLMHLRLQLTDQFVKLDADQDGWITQHDLHLATGHVDQNCEKCVSLS